ncbi:hypothetical protein BC826DRAFT_271359 [Russula brevipes]|nr:hypothetical protein BC826DRAFT_271359 [Russula brevipes]
MRIAVRIGNLHLVSISLSSSFPFLILRRPLGVPAVPIGHHQLTTSDLFTLHVGFVIWFNIMDEL